MTFEEYKNKKLLEFAKGYKSYYSNIKTKDEIVNDLLLASDKIDEHKKCWREYSDDIWVVKINESGEEIIYCKKCCNIMFSYSTCKQ